MNVRCLFIVNADSLLYTTVVLGLHYFQVLWLFVLLPAKFVILRFLFSPDSLQSFRLSLDKLEINIRLTGRIAFDLYVFDFDLSTQQNFKDILHAKLKLHPLNVFDTSQISFLLSKSLNWHFCNYCFF